MHMRPKLDCNPSFFSFTFQIKLDYSGRITAALASSSDQQHPPYWIYRINGSLSPKRKGFSYLCHLSNETWCENANTRSLDKSYKQRSIMALNLDLTHTSVTLNKRTCRQTMQYYFLIRALPHDFLILFKIIYENHYSALQTGNGLIINFLCKSQKRENCQAFVLYDSNSLFFIHVVGNQWLPFCYYLYFASHVQQIINMRHKTSWFSLRISNSPNINRTPANVIYV